MKDKRLMYVVKDLNTLTTTIGEYIASTSNWYRNAMNNKTAHGVLQTPLEYNMKFINSLKKGCGNVKSYLRSNGSLKKLKLYQFFFTNYRVTSLMLLKP